MNKINRIAKAIVNERCKLKVLIMIDMKLCNIKYGLSYSEYNELKFDLLNSKQRKQYLKERKKI